MQMWWSTYCKSAYCKSEWIHSLGYKWLLAFLVNRLSTHAILVSKPHNILMTDGRTCYTHHFRFFSEYLFIWLIDQWINFLSNIKCNLRKRFTVSVLEKYILNTFLKFFKFQYMQYFGAASLLRAKKKYCKK